MDRTPQEFAAIVQQAKDELVAQGVNLSGACGAFQILNRAVLALGPRYGLLQKLGGNRAIPQADGSCLTQDQSREPGYATDYLIDSQTFFGYDILSDGGGTNGVQWAGPEDAPDMVKRNKELFRQALTWWPKTAVVVVPVDPPVEPKVGDTPATPPTVPTVNVEALVAGQAEANGYLKRIAEGIEGLRKDASATGKLVTEAAAGGNIFSRLFR